MKTEKDVKKAVKDIMKPYVAKDLVWFFMPVPTGFGVMGIPDFMGVAFPGRAFAIETKFGKNTLSDWQARQIINLRAVGTKVWVVNDSNLSGFSAEFTEWVETICRS